MVVLLGGIGRWSSAWDWGFDMVIGALIPEAISGVLDIAKQVLGRWIPDTKARDEAAVQITLGLQQADLISMKGQLDIDLAEANSGSLFQGGWRPAVGWVCVVGLGWQYIIGPFFGWISAMFHGPAPPVMDMSALMPLLIGMLGLTVARSYERTAGVAAGQGPASRAAAVAKK